MCSHASFCALQHAAHFGAGLPEFAERLDRRAAEVASNDVSAIVRVKIIGNSVARWVSYLALRVFASILAGAWPSLRFEVPQTQDHSTDKKRVASHTEPADPLSFGGFSHDHALHCNLGYLGPADIVVVLYGEGLRSMNTTRQLYMRLLSLPKAPLVIVVHHCILLNFEVQLRGSASQSGQGLSAGLERIDPGNLSQVEHLAAAQRDIHLKENHDGFLRTLATNVEAASKMWGLEAAILDEMRLPHVDMCALLRTVHEPRKGASSAAAAAAAASSSSTSSSVSSRRPGTTMGTTVLRSKVPPTAPCTSMPIRDVFGCARGACRNVSERAIYSVAASGDRRHPPRFDVLMSGRAFRLDAAGWGDTIHPTAEHAYLQGCAAAHMLIHAARQRRQSAHRPALHADLPSARAHADAQPREPPRQAASWCVTAYAHLGEDPWHEALHLAQASRPAAALEWRLSGGGHGGYKRWWQPNRDGASMQLLLPATRPKLLVEYYAHDDLPMGAARVSVAVVARKAPSTMSAEQAVGWEVVNGTTDGGATQPWTLCDHRSDSLERPSTPRDTAASSRGASDCGAMKPGLTANGGPASGQLTTVLTRLAVLEQSVLLDTACRTCPAHQGFMQLATVVNGLPIRMRARPQGSLGSAATRTGMNTLSTKSDPLALLVTFTAIARGSLTNFSLVSVIGTE